LRRAEQTTHGLIHEDEDDDEDDDWSRMFLSWYYNLGILFFKVNLPILSRFWNDFPEFLPALGDRPLYDCSPI
jgi:hypothetical protein